MTEQYPQTNINNPRSPRIVANSVAAPNVELTPDDGFVVIDSTLAGGFARLPLAQSMPGRSITIISTAAGTNSMGFQAQAGNNLVEPAGVTNPIIVDNGSLTATSDGGDNWYITSGVV